jgi:hypothetical protein
VKSNYIEEERRCLVAQQREDSPIPTPSKERPFSPLHHYTSKLARNKIFGMQGMLASF